MNFVRDEQQSVRIQLGRQLNDGDWHQVEVKRNRMQTTLLVDETQMSDVAFGEDYRIRERNTKNYMYFGGIPLAFRGHAGARKLPAAVLDTQFLGEIRNILYFNCTCLPTRASPLELRGSEDNPREACDIRNDCPPDCPCISGDDDSGCWCEIRQQCSKGGCEEQKIWLSIAGLRVKPGGENRTFNANFVRASALVRVLPHFVKKTKKLINLKSLSAPPYHRLDFFT
ncbi:neurexin-2-alpha [Plakobranchus ocellatus]|uniref:Neurexin-2-alpha n=1 Tax=Plakobranchus ocellatus TaxID=259542 RepID=A0AAV3YKN7_9GAST|nr:neurexin-2-alpha [Plakobranchus ocellatus]